MLVRIFIVAALVIVQSLMLVAPGVAETPTSSTEDDWDVATGGHFFSQTGGGNPGFGFAVNDAEGIPFWSQFKQEGGVSALGYPVSKRFVWDGYTTQVFQRGVLTWHAQEKQVVKLNLLDVLHDRGKDDWLQANKGVPKPLDAANFDKGKSWPEVVAGRQALLDVNPAIKAAYFAVPNPIERYGLPTSQVVDTPGYAVVRLQRAVIQQWKNDAPWAKAGEVTVALAGDLARESGLFPAGDVWKAEDGTKLPPKWGWQVANRVIPEGEHWIDVSISDQSITAMAGAQAVFRAPATTGKPTFPSPEGTFYIYSRVYNETMDSLTLDIPHDSPEGYDLKNIYYTQYFREGGYAIHTNYWQPDSVFGAVPTSHGCVGMHVEDAKFFWEFANYGTKIVIHK
jgi:hypothetical protein